MHRSLQHTSDDEEMHDDVRFQHPFIIDLKKHWLI